jgi:hypothetical protein
MNLSEAQVKLAELEHEPKFERMLGVCSILTQMLHKHGIEPTIVGGFAVEIYSRSEYTTVDIDLVLIRRDLADECLRSLGFSKLGRHWFHDPLGVSVEIPGDILNLSDRNKVLKMNLPDGGFVYVIGIEDIILDRLRACVHWKSSSDCEWGARLLLTHRTKLDLEYMTAKALEDLTMVKFREWLDLG